MIIEPESLHRIQARARANLSLAARLGYVGLLLASAALTTVVVTLWITEPSLPARTQIAFGAMSLIGVSWCALAAWVLRARRPLFARDRVIAGRMAVAFTSVFAAAALAWAVFVGGPAAYGAFASGMVMLAAAIAVSARARRRFALLAARRQELEQALGR
ncbi:MAG TPA: hypothetical protein VFP37_05630 [Steroidobacteraceae bacterium]|nr:hypothetical protein [Steroidobacteraceae bacterium]